MNEPAAPEKNPLAFISHKHADKAIAAVVANFIRVRTLGDVDVYLSSDWSFEGPRFGSDLSKELRAALWRSNALILVYTSADQDWSFCMWECGTATHPESPDTNVVVFQCGRDVPTPFASDLRVDVRNIEHLRRFTKQLMTDPNFFPGHGRAIAPNCPAATLEEAAQELFVKFKEVLPEDVQAEEWPAWPFLRVELPKQQVEELEDAIADDRVTRSHEIVKDHAVVVKSDARAAQLFGLAYLSERQMFKDLLKAWVDAYPTSDPTWFDSCCAQIMASARRGFPLIQWTPLREVGGETEFTPVLSRIKRLPFGGSVHFDIFFYNLSDPQALSVTQKMVPVVKFFHKRRGRDNLAEIKLKQLVAELKLRDLDRVGVINEQGHPIAIVHLSMIGDFVMGKWASETQGERDEELTLEHLLNDEEMRNEFENFVAVKKRATLAEAKSSMRTTPGCRDVCVTEHGTWTEPVVGWLTNLDITQPV